MKTETSIFMVLVALVFSCNNEDLNSKPTAADTLESSSAAAEFGLSPVPLDTCTSYGGTYASGYLGTNRKFTSTPTEGSVFIRRCLKNVAGTKCGLDPNDGSVSLGAPLNIFEPAGSDKIFISVMGGGACWSAETCGLVVPVSLAINTRNKNNFWQDNAVQNPYIAASHGVMDSTYRQYEIPYCTGDVHLGNKVTSYVTNVGAQNFRHQGYANFGLYLDFIKSRNPNPKSIVIIGESAGAIGLNGNIKQIRDRWPTQPLNIIADSGVPYSRAVMGDGFIRALQTWNSSPSAFPTLPNTSTPDFLDALKYNLAKYSGDNNLRFGLIQPYSDAVLFAFGVALTLKLPALNSFHKITDTAYANMKFTSNFKIYAFNQLGEGEMHVCYAACPMIFPDRAAKLDTWVKNMISGSADWKSELP